MNLSGVGVWSSPLRYGDPAEAAEAAAELEELGYSALWFPDVGGPVFEAADRLLGATRETVVATGILNLWQHTPKETAEGYAAMTADHGDRFLLGIGVSHAPLIDADEPGRYRRPLAAMKEFLDHLDTAHPPVPADRRMLAALGPKMQALAVERTRGVHSYLTTPEQTGLTREALGDDTDIMAEQTVILCSDADEARSIGGEWLRGYLSLPNYANNVQRLGYSPEEVAQVDDRVFDALIAWGDEETIERRVDEHLTAGADHVCLQVLTPDGTSLPREQWRRLAGIAQQAK